MSATLRNKRRGSAPSAGQTLSARVRQLNRWRDNFNPARGLTMARAGWLVEAAMRGEWADFQWAFMAPVAGIECADADLLALIECRTSALLEMDWNVKAVDDSAGSQTQVQAVREMLDGIGNLYEAIEHLAMASFRGYAHCEKIYGDGELLELRVVPQFRVVREGGAGRWKYNAGDLSIGFAGLDDSWLVEPEDWVIREVPRFVNRVALTKYIRANLSQRDWDAFIEIYGIPGGIVIGPPDVPPDRERDYAVAAESAATSGHAYLPHGSSYAANDGPRGVNPFAEHIRFLSEQLVLAGTGGKLTMLAESGSGTLAGGAHMETFRRIARGEARKIGEIIQRQVVAPFLEERFPGAQEMAYFEMAFREEVESEQIVEDAVKLAGAGYRMDADELSEKTGYQLAMDEQDTESKRGDADLEEMLQEVAEADDEGLEDALAVLNREFPEVGAALGNGGPGSGRYPKGSGRIPKSREPKRMKATEAIAALQAGHEELDGEGRKIRFGNELLKKLQNKPDRLELLRWGYDAVRTGKSAVLKVKGEDRTHYGKIYKGKDRTHGFMVIVDTHDGYAFNLYIARPKQVAGKLENGARPEEQPSAGVLQAIAAASGLPDWGHYNTGMREVKE